MLCVKSLKWIWEPHRADMEVMVPPPGLSSHLEFVIEYVRFHTGYADPTVAKLAADRDDAITTLAPC